MTAEYGTIGRKLVSGSVLRVSNLVMTAAVSFFLMPFIVHHLGDRHYGFWSVAATMVVYYDLLDFGLSTTVAQFLSTAIGRNDPSQCRTVFNAALRVQSFLGSIALLATAAIAAATPWFCHDAADVRIFWKVIVILGVSGALGFPAKAYSGVLWAVLRFDIHAWLAIFGLTLRTSLLVWSIRAGGGLLALAWSTFIANVSVALLQVWFARRNAEWARIETTPIDRGMFRSFFSNSVYTFLTYLGDIVRFQIDSLVISGFIGLAAVTHYRIAALFAQYYLQILIVSVGMLQPVLTRFRGAGNQVGLEKLFFLGTKLSTAISVFICIALIGWGKPFIICWMGSGYSDAYPALVILSLAVFFDVSQKPSIDLLYATFQHRFYTYMNSAEAILNLGFSLALARPFGIVGVAMGTLIAAAVMRIAVQPWWVCKVSGLHYGAYMQFVGKNLLYCVFLMGAATAIVSWGLKPSYTLLVGSAVCVTVLYAIASWLFVLDSQDRERLLSALRRGEPKMQVQAVTAS